MKISKYLAPVILSLLSATYIAQAQIVNPSQPATGVPVAGTGISVAGQTVSVNYGVANSPFTGNMSVGGTFGVTGASTLGALNAGTATLGATSATTLSASSTVSGAGFTSLFASPPSIGSTAAGTGAFTTLANSSTFTSTGAAVLNGAVSGTGLTTYEANLNHVQTVLNVAALRAVSCVPGLLYKDQGYTTLGDGGDAQYVCNGADTTSADNGGSILASASVFRLYLQAPNARISVKAFGAKGNGTGNDQPAIQAAINYINPNVWNASFNYQQGGGVVYFPKGVYEITSGVYLQPFVTLEGDGPDGWTGGGAGTGVTALTSPPNGSIIYANFGVSAQVAIDTTNYLQATGVNYGNQTLGIIPQANFPATYSPCQGVAMRNIGVYTPTAVAVGVRLQGSSVSKFDNVSIIGFNTGMIVNSSYVYQHTNLFILYNQVGIFTTQSSVGKINGLIDGSGWGTSNGSVITPNGLVTSGNKPFYWSTNDTNYNPTSLYYLNNLPMQVVSVTAQHTGRAMYAETTNVNSQYFYVEDLPFLTSGPTPGAFNAYNASTTTGNTLLFDQLFSAANGTTLFNNVTNTPMTVTSFSGIQGTTYGPTGTGMLTLGPNFARNGAYGDTAYDSRITYSNPIYTTYTPSLTNITGTGVTATGACAKVGQIYHCTVNITGTTITATGGGASSISTPFNGTGGYPALARNSSASVAVSSLANVGNGQMQTNANLYIPAISVGVSQISITWDAYPN